MNNHSTQQEIIQVFLTQLRTETKSIIYYFTHSFSHSQQCFYDLLGVVTWSKKHDDGQCDSSVSGLCSTSFQLQVFNNKKLNQLPKMSLMLEKWNVQTKFCFYTISNLVLLLVLLWPLTKKKILCYQLWYIVHETWSFNHYCFT